MPKPGTVPNWATDANIADPGQPWDGTPTKVAPAAGQIASGWKPRQKPPAQYKNWWKNLTGQWFTWLDGLFDGADNLNLPGNLTLGANKNVAISGTGLYKRGMYSRFYPVADGTVQAGAPTLAINGSGYTYTALNDKVIMPIHLDSFERIVNCHFIVTPGAGDVFTGSIRYQFMTGAFATGEGGVAPVVSVGAGMQSIDLMGINLQYDFTSLATGTGKYSMSGILTATTFATGPIFHGMILDIDIP
jgi:hypothetical protein